MNTTAHFYTAEEIWAAIRRLKRWGVTEQRAIELIKDAFPEFRKYLLS